MADSKLLNASNSSSPPPNCAICLGSCSNKCFSDTCRHQFCFKCLLQWSKIKAECPLCKQPFKSIIHNVKSNEEYEEHIVEEPRPVHIIDNDQYLYLPQSPPRQHRFHFRTTFTVNTHGENAIQQMLLSHSLTNGISFSNYIPGSWHHYNRRSRRENSTTTNFRRSIYNGNLWASAPVDVTGVYREVTPEYFQANPASRTRLAPWLNRELNALLFENTQDVMQLVDTIMDYLLRYHICSRTFRNLLQTYLGERTDHFVHEFYNFMRSPYDMIGYDRHVIYMERPTSPTPFIDISEDDSSDVMIVEERPDIIEVSSNDSDSDVIMMSFPSEMPKPQVLPVKSFRRHRRLETIGSSSSDREQQTRREDRSRRRKKRKMSTGDRSKKQKPLKLADFVMDDSTSSEFDDLPLAKYLRIKASIDKRILKKSSHLTMLKKSKKPRSHRKSQKSGRKVTSRVIDLSASVKPKVHCSKYVSSRRRASSSSSSSDSSSSSSSDTNSSGTSRVRSRSSSPWTSRQKPKVRSKLNMLFGPSSTSEMAAPKEIRQETTLPHSLDLSSSTTRSIIGCTSTEQSPNPSHIPKLDFLLNKEDESHDYYPHYNHQFMISDEPSTSSGLRQARGDSPKSRVRRKNPDPLKLKLKARNLNGCHHNQSNSTEEPLELTNHRRYTPELVSPSPYVPDEQNQVISSSTLLSISPNRTSGVQDDSCYFNSSQSPDLIDLSVSKIKNDAFYGEQYLPYNSNSTGAPTDSFDLTDGDSQRRLAAARGYPSWPSTSQQQCSSTRSSNNYYQNLLMPKREPKTEPVYPEYHAEGVSRYWTDFAVQNPVAGGSAGFGYRDSGKRKSVIQNLNLDRDFSVPFGDGRSPKWSTSSDNSGAYARNMARFSDSSD